MAQAALRQRHLRAVDVGIIEERRGVTAGEHGCHRAHGLLTGLLHVGQRQFDTHQGQRLAARMERLFELREQGVLRDPREVDLRLLEIRSSLVQCDGNDLAAAIEIAVQVLELGALAERLDRQLVARLPPVVTEEGA